MTSRKPVHLALTALAALMLPAMAACGQDAPEASRAKPEKTEQKTARPVTFDRETDRFTFSYAYPAEAAVIPELASLLEAERAKDLANLESEAAEAEKDAKANDYPYNPHMRGASWSTTGNTGPLLAMLGEISSYSSGAHGNTAFEVLLWDKAASRRIKLEELFTDMDAALEPMRKPYCDALNAERLDRRGEYMSDDPDDMFNVCPPFSDLTIVPSAVGNDGFDRIMFVAAPYVAGPYAEGAYEISVAVTGKTLAAVKPAYRAAFSNPAE
jgi:predicted small lipoprotein YifL